MGKSTQAIGVLAGIDEDYGFIEKIIDFRTFGGGQVIGYEWYGIAAARFVSVDTIPHPYHDRHGFQGEGRRLRRVAEKDVFLLDCFDVSVVLWRRDGEKVQGTMLVGSSIFLQGEPIGYFGQFADVCEDLIRTKVPVPNLISKKGFWSWDGRVIGDVGGEVVVQGYAALSGDWERDRHQGNY